MRYFLLILIFIKFFQYGNSQTLKFEKDTISLGEEIVLNILPAKSSGDAQAIALDFGKFKNQIYQQDTNLFEPFAELEILEIDNTLNFKNNLLLIPSIINPVKIKLIFYSIGSFVVKNGSDSTIINVFPPAGMDMKNLSEIKDIKEIEEADGVDWLSILLYSLLLLISLAVLYYLFKKFSEKLSDPIIAPKKEILLDPYDEALKGLEKLKATEAYKSEDIKGFQSQLTNILRTYISKKYNIKAMEMTSAEIIDKIKRKDIAIQSASNEIDYIFFLSDMVKFAKATASEEMCYNALEKSIDFLRKTKDGW